MRDTLVVFEVVPRAFRRIGSVWKLRRKADANWPRGLCLRARGERQDHSDLAALGNPDYRRTRAVFQMMSFFSYSFLLGIATFTSYGFGSATMLVTTCPVKTRILCWKWPVTRRRLGHSPIRCIYCTSPIPHYVYYIYLYSVVYASFIPHRTCIPLVPALYISALRLPLA